MLIHVTGLDAVQLQSATAVTVTVPLPPLEGSEVLAEAIE
jgi:hypothetical protein